MGLSDRRQTTNTNSTSSTTNRYGFQTPPSTPDIDRLRNQQFQIDPSIGYRLGEKERQLSDSLANPTGGFVTPQIRDAIMRSGRRELMQQAGQQTREGAYDVNRLNYGRNLATAQMTQPILTQEGSTTTGSGTGTVSQGQSPWATIFNTGASAAPFSL